MPRSAQAGKDGRARPAVPLLHAANQGRCGAQRRTTTQAALDRDSPVERVGTREAAVAFVRRGSSWVALAALEGCAPAPAPRVGVPVAAPTQKSAVVEPPAPMSVPGEAFGVT